MPPDDPSPLLEIRQVSKRFTGVQALDHVDFSAGRGEIVGLIGENGAGKSTLMNILGGVITIDSGEISIGGKQVEIRGVPDAIKLGIAFIHQETNVLDNLSVAANVFLGREPLKAGPLKIIDRAKLKAETQPFLDMLGMGISAGAPVLGLSIAQQQLVEIAKAISLDAKIVIMDEPTSSLTLSETDRLFEVVRELKAKGVTVIYISHRLAEIVGLADRVVALRDGRNAGELKGKDIQQDAMIRLMVGRELAAVEQAHRFIGQEVRLQVRNLRTRRYPGQEVSFEVRKGEILGMAGLVGAGRSEMAQTVFGVDVPLAGQITLDGKPIRVRDSRDAISHRIYLAPEDRRKSGVVIDMTIRENVTLPAMGRFSTLGLVRKGAEKKAASHALASLRIKAPSAETVVKNLSGGNQQKVVLSKWLELNPDVLIFDEPTRGIDVGAKAEIYELMRGLAEQGVAILMISSDMEEILRMSDRVAVMHEGAISGVLSREEATEEGIMRLAVGAE